MREVIFHYFRIFVYVGLSFFIALTTSYIFNKQYKRFITSKFKIVLLVLGTSFLLVAGIGKLGWHSEITTWTGSQAEKWNDNIFCILSYLGSFFVFLDICLSFFQDKDKK